MAFIAAELHYQDLLEKNFAEFYRLKESFPKGTEEKYIAAINKTWFKLEIKISISRRKHTIKPILFSPT